MNNTKPPSRMPKSHGIIPTKPTRPTKNMLVLLASWYKRIFDILVSTTALFLLSPVFILIALFIVIDSWGAIFFKQNRVGKNNTDFKMYKFRTMKKDSEKKGFLTIGNNDSRVTRMGYYLRKSKLDELPQLINVLIGDMSLVGPRPEVRMYVNQYTEEQKKVLSVKPGITDQASILYSSESELLAKSSDPEKTYVEEIMPHKLKLNLKYIQQQSLWGDIKILLRTVGKIL